MLNGVRLFRVRWASMRAPKFDGAPGAKQDAVRTGSCYSWSLRKRLTARSTIAYPGFEWSRVIREAGVKIE
jgi:hypothetical protein